MSTDRHQGPAEAPIQQDTVPNTLILQLPQATFRKAEGIQWNIATRKDKPRSSLLPDTLDYWFCALLLEQGKAIVEGWIEISDTCLNKVCTCGKDYETSKGFHIEVLNRFEDIRKRAQHALSENCSCLPTRTRGHGKFAQALYRLTWGHASLLEARYHGQEYQRLKKEEVTANPYSQTLKDVQEQYSQTLKDAQNQLLIAKEQFLESGHQIYSLCCLLIYASLHRTKGYFDEAEGTLDFDGAEDTLKEVLEIATRGEVKLFEADYHLEQARLNFDCYKKQRDPERLKMAQLNLTDAEALVSTLRYGRRDYEVALLKRELLESIEI